MKASLGWLCLMVICFTACRQLPTDLSEMMKTYAEKGHNRNLKSPFSGAILIAKDGEIILKSAYGWADRDQQQHNQVDSKFAIASVTKQFTAMLILQLVEAQRLQLSDTLGKFLPELPPAMTQRITIHQLLSHTSGLRHYDGLMALGLDQQNFLTQAIAPDDWVKWIGQTQLDYSPGTRYQYSSLGYLLLGVIVERLTGQDYATVLREQITEPLGMKNTGFADNEFIANNLVRGYRFVEDESWRAPFRSVPGEFKLAPFRDQSIKYSTGGMHSTVEDLFVWTQALREHRLLSPELSKLLFQPNQQGYAYGWIINWDDLLERNTGVEVVSHGGYLPGYTSHVAMHADGTTIIFLANVTPINEKELLHQTYLATHQLADTFRLSGFPDMGSLENFREEGGLAALNDYFARLSQLAGYSVVPSPHALQRIATLHIDQKQFAIADSLGKIILEHHPKRQSSINQMGYTWLEAGACQRALRYFEHNVEVFPYSANAWDSKGEGLQACQQMEAARDCFLKAIALARQQGGDTLVYQKHLVSVTAQF